MPPTQKYPYIGSKDILRSTDLETGGRLILGMQDILDYATEHASEFTHGRLTVTFIVDGNGNLVINGRHSEHVMAARGEAVLAAGEMVFEREKDNVSVSEVSNLSTGYCPKPESWTAVKLALDKIGIVRPEGFARIYEFRLCEQCRCINLIKDGVLECSVCNAELDEQWNFALQ